MRNWFLCGAVSVVMVSALPVLAQSVSTTLDEARQRLAEECAAGDESACIRQRITIKRDAEGNITVDLAPRDGMQPASQQETPLVEVDQVDPEQVETSDNAVTPPATEDRNWWKVAFFVLLGLFVLRLVIRAAATLAGDPDEDAKQQAWNGDPLELPRILPGERRDQGDLIDIPDRQRQLYPWDRSKIYAWLEERMSEIEDQVSEPLVLEFMSKHQAGEPDEVIKKISEQYGEKRWERQFEDDFEQILWDDLSSRYFDLYRARHGFVGGAYLLANSSSFSKVFKLSDELLIALWRLDADRDFNPAMVNIWSHIYEERLYYEDYVDLRQMEGYLRYFFRLGAPDGHFHIATQLVTYYIYTPYIRKDHGYLAAAMERVKSYDRGFYKTYKVDIDRNKTEVDLEDQSVPREGVMMEMEQAGQSRLQ